MDLWQAIQRRWPHSSNFFVNNICLWESAFWALCKFSNPFETNTIIMWDTQPSWFQLKGGEWLNYGGERQRRICWGEWYIKGEFLNCFWHQKCILRITYKEQLWWNKAKKCEKIDHLKGVFFRLWRKNRIRQEIGKNEIVGDGFDKVGVRLWVAKNICWLQRKIQVQLILLHN